MKVPKILGGIFIALIAVTTLTFATLEYYVGETNMSNYVKIDVIKVGDNGYIYFSNNNCTGVIARTSLERAKSIRKGKEEVIEGRPNTHDIFEDTLKHFNITLKKVIVTELKNNTYFAKMILKRKDKVLRLDCKPSDGMALALRTNSSIYMNKSLFEERKKDIC